MESFLLKLVMFEVESFWEGFGFNPFGGGFDNYIYDILQFFVGVSSLVAVAMIVYGAYVLMTSSGDPDNISKGQRVVTNAVIGLVIIGIAWLIINFVIKTTVDAM